MRMKGFVITACLLVLTAAEALAQCAMCRTQLENNFSNGNPGIGAGINTGILYLLALPYLIVIVLGYLWYKTSKNGQNESSSTLAR